MFGAFQPTVLLRHVKGLRLSNVSVEVASPDPASWCAKMWRIRHLWLEGAMPNSAHRSGFRNVRRALLHGSPAARPHLLQVQVPPAPKSDSSKCSGRASGCEQGRRSADAVSVDSGMTGTSRQTVPLARASCPASARSGPDAFRSRRVAVGLDSLCSTWIKGDGHTSTDEHRSCHQHHQASVFTRNSYCSSCDWLRQLALPGSRLVL